MKADILIVDDEKDIREMVSGILVDEGYTTRTAHDSNTALMEISNHVPQLVLLDIWIEGSSMDGMSLLDEIKNHYPDIPVVMISGHGNIETAVSAIKRGAFDYIEKPFETDRLLVSVHRALENSSLKREVCQLRRQIGEEELIGSSVAVSQLRQTIDRVAPTNSRVMIFGPSGSGKELVARLIHKKSARRSGSFIVLSAANITSEFMEIALFGIEGSSERPRKIGLLEEAHQGTLYIDEIADMPRETQNKILRVLVEQQFERVGGVKRVKVDVRIISSTAVNLENRISEGLFREDLYYRLAVVPIRVPALIERREDIPILTENIIKKICQQIGIRSRYINDDAMAILQAYEWPGNIRELRNNLERIIILTNREESESEITADMLPADLSEFLPKISIDNNYRIMALPLREAREMFEKNYLIAQINRFGRNISRTAEFVGMERSALHRKLKSLGL
ncbi:putative two component response regulator nitrogen assimilation regulatory protein [Liberibacter crescens BT-1]|uniref:C4-dicarboxylate transport transcriptional regulatory protein DctD n=1 Tax=Liberibacter crescens (strain BT-1) TaxID=1215343 RepID=L0ES09_LIBCB|nr:sigma-54 dependent transcriptional regulator [Liberibacter crescens]AGA64284.1 putative two component response regulator nitrogen assimilation regulatory protein [Liberibacter crescens BT-1]AMC12510.1 ATPase AAA [Liberibacter crescens]